MTFSRFDLFHLEIYFNAYQIYPICKMKAGMIFIYISDLYWL